MSQAYERNCVGCEKSEEDVRLEVCSGCGRYFCFDCGVRAGYGRKFCSQECARAYYFSGDSDDDEDGNPDDE